MLFNLLSNNFFEGSEKTDFILVPNNHKFLIYSGGILLILLFSRIFPNDLHSHSLYAHDKFVTLCI